MSRMHRIAALAALALSAVAHAAPDVNTDGSPVVHKKPTLAAQAGHQLRQDDVPSAKTDPQRSVAAQAQADMAARDARAKGPRLHVERQNLTGDAAKRAIQERTNPNTIDRATAFGDKDHTEQVTDLKVTLKK